MAVASVGTLAGLPAAVGLGAGCAYFSMGVLYFFCQAIWGDVRLPSHSPAEDSLEAVEYRLPYWIDTRMLNWGVVGRVGAGKSSLVNALRAITSTDPRAAAVGIGHTTWIPQPYNLISDVDTPAQHVVRLWDLPGAGTSDWPSESYIPDAGLRFFDGVIFVLSGAPLDTELHMLQRLREFKVPHYVVRSKVDQDVVNNAEDIGAAPLETVAEVRTELLNFACCDDDRIFVISTRQDGYEFGDFRRVLSNAINEQCKDIFGTDVPIQLAPSET
jgi:GTPase SAR1 family protein